MTNQNLDTTNSVAILAQLVELSEKISRLNDLLALDGEQKVSVTIENGDGAIHDLVSRVVEEVLIRVKQENILRVTNG